MNTPKPRKVKVAIVGGGIAGMALVLAMQRICKMADLEVHIYESAAQMTQVGAGIGLWQRTLDLLSDMGMGRDFQALREEHGAPTGFTLRKSDQAEGETFSQVSLESEGDGRMLLLHRARLQEVFLKHISKDVRIHLAHRLESYSYTDDATEKILLTFQDGQEARCDLLCGADGVASAVRHNFLPRLARKTGKPEYLESVDAVFSGSCVYRDLVPADKLAEVWPNHPAAKGPHQYCGKDMHIVTYPVQQGTLINAVPFYCDLSKENSPFFGSQIGASTTEEVLKRYEGWEPEVKALLGCMSNPVHWAILTIKPLDVWADDGVFLLGDAAHAMTPHLGAGAGQGIEDAYYLAKIFAHAQKKGPHEILSAEPLELYNRLRPPVANFVQARSRLQTLFYEFNEEGQDLSLVEARSPAHAEQDRLKRLEHGIWDGYRWSRHSIVRQWDAEAAKVLS
ncbi:hypothetical protein BD626DRAFT_544851 [Schizophyllum amplum]|uniref:FAD-binding domain-containing protein n=1 Tax=Schizophyllum amplum TaxID=97359 RepID=A0A550D0L4_9AGAR|nr:hypothetical protein BD626DRAFT_544851 [Auriculariopsis ampla]